MMIEIYRTVEKAAHDEIIIERSRFIGYCMPVATEEAALAFIKEIKSKHWDATHNVHGYVIGENNEIQRYSDDGEPSGTAGVPVLEVIKKENLRNVAVVVTRYFGGIKLGAGGLVRAYTKGAKIALEAGGIITKILAKVLRVSVAYPLLGKLQNELMSKGHSIKEVLYDEKVHFLVYLPLEEIENFKAWIIDLTNSQCTISEGEVQYLTQTAQGLRE